MLDIIGILASPLLFALLTGLAAMLVWMAFAPARPSEQVEERLEGYVERGDIIEATELNRSVVSRTMVPAFFGLLGFLGRLLPQRQAAQTQQMLVMAGRPGQMSALDFMGLRLLSAILFGLAGFFLLSRNLDFGRAVLLTVLLTILGYLLPWLWLRRRVRKRQREIERALPDALDMMTIGVEAGLAFESAMIRVSEQWDNALTQEMRQAVAEMRVGTSRNVALQRMAERTGVPSLRTFVAVLIQSSQLGVSIADVLHAQADEMRVRRRQRAEELARQAGVKMIFPLALLIFPALMVVILGPTIPVFIDLFRTLTGG